jgi:hypothetical protein
MPIKDALVETRNVLMLERPAAMDKDYNTCTLYDKGACDLFSALVVRFASTMQWHSPEERAAWTRSIINPPVH